MEKKKIWITPTFDILSRGNVEGGNHPSMHENTGHTPGHTPNNHAPGGAGVPFLNSPGGDSLPNWTHAQHS